MKRLVLTILALAVAIAGWAAPKQATTFDGIMSHYEAIRLALLNDTTSEIATHAKEISVLARAATKRFDAGSVGIDAEQKGDCVELLPQIEQHAGELAAAADITEARDAFFELSKSLVKLKAMASGDHAPQTYYCSMAKRSWLQPGDEVGNPYLGQKMAKCGQKVED